MSDLVVRAYNVGFGDAILVSVPEATGGDNEETRHLLIDVGNLLAGEGNQDEVFTGVVADIAERTGGVVDLYVMTHEHLDHVQGLLAAKRAGDGIVENVDVTSMMTEASDERFTMVARTSTLVERHTVDWARTET